jgi:hypothetical protein
VYHQLLSDIKLEQVQLLFPGPTLVPLQESKSGFGNSRATHEHQKTTIVTV